MTTEQVLRTALTSLVGVRHPVVQTGMGWVAGPRLVSATAAAGGLGILASATMTYDELEHAIVEVKRRTAAPFGVNLRADAVDAKRRAELLVRHEVRVASFALAPKRDLIAQLKDGGVVVMPSVGAPRHAEKVAAWGADAVMVQGSEGGGHTGSVSTTLLLPSVVDAVDIPVVASGGYFDGRGLAAALAFGAAGIGMGTRFLLTRESTVPDAIKRQYLACDLSSTVVTDKVDGVPHRLIRTPFVERLHRSSLVRRLPATLRRTLAFRKQAELSWWGVLIEGGWLLRSADRGPGALLLAANTPTMLRAGLVEGDVDAGVLSAGQVTGLIDDLPSCEELIDRVVAQAVRQLRVAGGAIHAPAGAADCALGECGSPR